MGDARRDLPDRREKVRVIHALLHPREAGLRPHVSQPHEHDENRGKERRPVERGSHLHERVEGVAAPFHDHRSHDAPIVLHHRRVPGLQIGRALDEEARVSRFADHRPREGGLIQRGAPHQGARRRLAERQNHAMIGIEKKNVRGARPVGEPAPVRPHRVGGFDRVHRRLEVRPERVGGLREERIELVGLDEERRRVSGRLEALAQLLVQEMVRGLDRVDDGPVDEHEERPEVKKRPEKARRLDGR